MRLRSPSLRSAYGRMSKKTRKDRDSLMVRSPSTKRGSQSSLVTELMAAAASCWSSRNTESIIALTRPSLLPK